MSLSRKEKIVDGGASSKTTCLLEETKNDEPSNKEEKSLVLCTIALGFVMLVQSFLVVSVFSYSGFMAMHLVPNLTEETAGSYAGFIASSFMIGRTFSSFHWGKIADKYGRTFVIKASLLLSAIFTLLFGLAPTFGMALLWRFLLGFCNGIIGPVNTLISEIAKGDEAKETRTMALTLGMWGYGFILNPAIGGYLSDPVKQYPNSQLVQQWEPLLKAFPFVLPNVFGFVVCVISFVLVDNFVEETLPAAKRQEFRFKDVALTLFGSNSTILRTVSSWGLFKHMNYMNAELTEKTMESKKRSDSISRWSRPSPSTTALVMLSSHSKEEENGEQEKTTIAKADKQKDDEPATITSLMKRKPTRHHLIVYWVYSFLVSTLDESFPLFCISIESGLGIQEKLLGNIYTGMGFCYIVIQYFLVTNLVDKFGMYKALSIGTLFSVPMSGLLPITLISNRAAPQGHLTWSTLIFVSVTYAIMRACSSVTFSTITMTTNRTVPAHQRATMNGLSILGGSVGKAAGPVFIGVLFSTCVGTITPPYGSVVVYGIVVVMGLVNFVMALLLQNRYSKGKSTPSLEVGDNCAKEEEDGEEEEEALAF